MRTHSGQPPRLRAVLVIAGAVALVVGTVGALALVQRTSDTGAPEPAGTWSETRTPWLEFERPSLSLNYGKAHFDLAAGAGELRKVVSIAATHDSALIELRDDTLPNTITDVRATGESKEVASGVIGVPIADPGGHLAVWSERDADNQTRLVAYDTARSEVVATLDTAADVRVTVVDDRDVYVASSTETFTWSPYAKADLGPLPSVFPDGVTISDVEAKVGFFVVASDASRLYDMDGQVLRTFDAGLYGTFDPTGSAVAVSGGGAPLVLDVKKNQPISMELPDGQTPFRFRWGPDGNLVIATAPSDPGSDEVSFSYFNCSVPGGECTALPGSLPTDLAETYESSTNGQFTS